jgi:hypothetical protein
VRLEPTDPTAAAADLDGSRGGILKFWKIASWLTGEIIRLGARAFRIDRLINRVRRAWPFWTKFRIFQRLLGFFLTDYLRHRIATFRLSPIFGRVPVIAAAAILMWAMAAMMSSKNGCGRLTAACK